MNKRNTKRGFTITELVIVIVVIAILAAVLIPTFVSLINKANQSADIQAVRQMNTVLKADEAINGKPPSVTAMKAVLAAEGIVDLKPMYKNNAFAWHNVDNVVILMDQETQKGVFPKEYKGKAYDATTWEIFGGTVNVAMEELGANLDEALQNAKPGQTIVLAEDQTLAPAAPIQSASIDLNGKKLTVPNGLPMEENANIEISNGAVESARIDVADGASLTLNDVDIVFSGEAIIPNIASHIEINGGSIIADVPIATNYSDGWCRDVVLNINGATLGSEENPCSIGIMLIIDGDTTITDCTIYATDVGILNRAGKVTVENTVINYNPTVAYADTYGGGWTEHSDYTGVTPGNIRQYSWSGGSGGFKAPIVVGDFYSQHYSYDADCTLVKVTVNKTSDLAKTYPDVYLSQENYDVVPWGAGTNAYGKKTLDWTKVSSDNPKGAKELVNTYLTCDNTITWAVNPGKNDEFAVNATGDLAPFTNYAGFAYSNGTYGGIALLYVDNVFVNGVEQAKGSTSANPIPAN